MKKIIITILALILIIGCSKTATEPSNSTVSSKATQPKTTSFVDYEEIARIHDEGLDYIYNGLRKILVPPTTKSVLPYTYEEVIDFTAQLSISFMQLKFSEIGTQLSTEQSEIAGEMISWALNHDWSNNEETINHIMDNPNYSEVVKYYLVQIVEIEAKNYGQIVSALSIIENSARKNIVNADDLEIVLGHITITSSSIKYWKDNQEDWKQMLLDYGVTIIDTEKPCFVSGWDADSQMSGYLDDWTFGLWDEVSTETWIWGGSAIIGASAGQAIYNWWPK